MKTITIALVGAGFAAHFHGKSYAKVHGVNIKLKTIVDINIEKAEEIAKMYGFEKFTADYNDVLNDEEIDVIDIVTPPHLHIKLALKALKAGKHVICEKPLTGYFGEEGDETPIGDKVSKAKMFESVLKEMNEAKEVIEKNHKMFMYAENYIYSPNILKAAEIIRGRKSKLLFMKGEGSIKGSTSPVAGMWDKTGGGVLIRLGCHPLSGVLWLKQVEAEARGEEISVVSITADTGNISAQLTGYEKRHLTSKPIDVEDFANVIITFSDGTKAVVMASDNILGGVKNHIEIYGNDSVLMCNITPTDNMKTYFVDQEGLENIYISEMMEEKMGWNNVFIAEDILRGYTYELQDFVECVAYDRKPLSGIELAYETTKVIYAAYLSASEGRKVTFDSVPVL
ncbi:Gfo/Idh/MocA family protein [Priestia endophytica]|uniref:Gfo/Idh/MocA family protein n=1 Tax=Priestia endophytica TaxID=135735 RepID=UPI000DCA63BA|nr:Gfo/Idh/MocA family oxidoreductase [Priestia endophytica]RAS83647.1 oxidoreductase [Priestia endophytica]